MTREAARPGSAIREVLAQILILPGAVIALEGWLALGILVAAALLFITKWLPIEVVSLGIPVALYVTGVIKTPAEALQGFGSNAVIAIGAVFIIAAGLQESGIAGLLARLVQKLGGTSEVRLLVLLSVAVALLSAVMPNAATVAMLLPAVSSLCRRTGIAPSRLLMPLAFAALLGGNLTLIGTSSNILLSGDLAKATGAGFGMFDFTTVGAPLVVAGILFMAFVGHRVLPVRTTEERYREAQLPEELARSYGMTQSLFLVKVGRHSKLREKTIAEAEVGSRYDLQIVRVMRRRGIGSQFLEPDPDLRLEVGDQLYLEGEDEAVMNFTLEEQLQLALPEERIVRQVLSRGMSVAEVVLSPRSQAEGKSFREMDFRKVHGLNVIALWRNGAPVRTGIADLRLVPGDAFIVSGSLDRIHRLAAKRDYLVLVEEPEVRAPRRAPLAALLLLVAVVPTLFGIDLSMSALAAAVLMVATGCVKLETVERAIDWKVLFLIIGTIPLGQALDQHHVAAVAGEALTAASSIIGEPALLALLFLLAASLSIATSNAAAAVVLAPVAAQISASGGPSAHHTFLVVAYGCSCAFIVPFANQCNLMVMGPGGYRSRDFFRLGLGISIVVGVTAVGMLSIL